MSVSAWSIPTLRGGKFEEMSGKRGGIWEVCSICLVCA